MSLNIVACDTSANEDHEYESLPPDPAFIKTFEDRVARTIREHKLLEPGEPVLVAVSGGKDSTVLLAVLHKLGYKVSAVTVDVHIGCYTEKNLENIKRFCTSLGVKLYTSSFRKAFGAGVCYLRDKLREQGAQVNSCTVCGVLRRNLLNQLARETGAKNIATGHNLDDEVQTVLMNLVRNRQSLNARIGPIAGLTPDKRFVTRIKPLFFCRESDIEQYSKMNVFPVHYKRCPCSYDGLRNTVRETIKTFDSIEPNWREQIMTFFLKHQATVREHFKAHATTARACGSCGEPCSSTLCRTCQLLHQAKAVGAQVE